jgi:hypothetical protein
MIQDVMNRKNLPAVTSDHWHVIHARFAGVTDGKPKFERSIVSEHEDRAAAAAAAREMKSSILPTMVDRPLDGQDQVLVRKPDFKSLKVARRVESRRK